MEFTDVVRNRRSAAKFIPDTPIRQQELDEMFQLVKFAPSAFNLQHAKYVVVTEPQARERVYEAANRQHKVKTASAAILVLGDTRAYEDAAQINEGLLHLGILNKQEYDLTVESVTGFYLERGETFMREEAIRNASLSAMLFMMIAKDKGWDTCPIIGFDADKMREALQVPEHLVPALLIAIGKEDTNGGRPRGYRKPVGEFVIHNGF
ncbi:nitroreductase family protein [Paenibacillus sp. 598K]|uniref:nitroreductase family protein n=1 Tax=Paenibacillus sp. 598K TaxID=1117987 RepID=UPI000FF9AB4F|nr:nitroreductase family protein [Paenibacillus sp. 598K]GBF72205.1 nitroreductase family protein [Paenibacillus sp. 598K]